ncbi:MAG: hypothetical protein KatS3mg027_1738 [Bacteroidia bacterium]|nr:MAG: hypothetical protein KatS3mg027_1738 [Bacteroidia bacterium]
MTKREYLLKVSNANMVEQVFQALENLEIKDVYILRVNHSKLDSIKKVVKIMAIKDAKSKADYLLQAIGEQTGKPLIVKEIETKASNSKESVLNVRGGRSTNNTYFIDGVEMSQNNVIEFEKIKVHCSIYVKFSIK